MPLRIAVKNAGALIPCRVCALDEGYGAARTFRGITVLVWPIFTVARPRHFPLNAYYAQ